MTFAKIRVGTRSRATLRGLLLLVSVWIGQVAAQMPAELTPENAARLRRLIENGSVEEKRTALFDIRNLQSAAASAIALPALNDKDVMVRSTAAASVAYLPAPDAVRALVPLLNDRDEFVRREAAHALGDVGDASSLPALVRLLGNEKVLEVRTAVVSALGRIGDPGAIDTLVKILQTRPVEDEEFLRRNAARSIGLIAQITLTGNRTAVTPQNFLPDKFKDLGPRGSTLTPPAVGIEVLMKVLTDPAESDDTRREAAYALGWIGDIRAVAALRSSLSSPDPYLAQIAREALMRIEHRNKPPGSED